MHWGWNGEYGMGFGFGWFFMILFLILIILGAVYLVKILTGGMSSDKETKESAEDVLKKRFARGEINKDELETGLEILKKLRD